MKRPRVNEDMGTAATSNASISRGTDRGGTESTMIKYERSLIIPVEFTLTEEYVPVFYHMEDYGYMKQFKD